MNQESSPDLLAFQVAHTTISPNYPGEEFKTPVVSAMLPEPSDDNKKSPPLPQVQAYNRLMSDKLMPTPGRSTPTSDRSTPTLDKSMPTPGNKHLWHQLPHSSDAKMMYLAPTYYVRRARDLLRDFERDGLEVYNSPQTNLGAALAALNHLEDSLMIRRLQANVCIAAAQIEERGPGYSRSAASFYSRSKSRLERTLLAQSPSTPRRIRRTRLVVVTSASEY
jgi:hypothetical protein